MIKKFHDKKMSKKYYVKIWIIIVDDNVILKTFQIISYKSGSEGSTSIFLFSAMLTKKKEALDAH